MTFKINVKANLQWICEKICIGILSLIITTRGFCSFWATLYALDERCSFWRGGRGEWAGQHVNVACKPKSKMDFASRGKMARRIFTFGASSSAVREWKGETRRWTAVGDETWHRRCPLTLYDASWRRLASGDEATTRSPPTHHPSSYSRHFYDFSRTSGPPRRRPEPAHRPQSLWGSLLRRRKRSRPSVGRRASPFGPRGGASSWGEIFCETLRSLLHVVIRGTRSGRCWPPVSAIGTGGRAGSPPRRLWSPAASPPTPPAVPWSSGLARWWAGGSWLVCRRPASWVGRASWGRRGRWWVSGTPRPGSGPGLGPRCGGLHLQGEERHFVNNEPPNLE